MWNNFRFGFLISASWWHRILSYSSNAHDEFVRYPEATAEAYAIVDAFRLTGDKINPENWYRTIGSDAVAQYLLIQQLTYACKKLLSDTHSHTQNVEQRV